MLQFFNFHISKYIRGVSAYLLIFYAYTYTCLYPNIGAYIFAYTNIGATLK